MEIERWAEVSDIYDNPNLDGFQVSDWGNVRSFWHVLHHGRGATRTLCYDMPPKTVPQSLTEDGYYKVNIRPIGGRQMSPKVHVMVAKAFVYNPDPIHLDTVDHIQSGAEGKLNNHYTNLRWMSRGDNIRKAWADGVCEGRRRNQCKPTLVEDINTGHVMYFPSLRSACYHLDINEDTARHAMSRMDDPIVHTRYSDFRLDYLEGKDRLFADHDDEYGRGLYDYDGFWH